MSHVFLVADCVSIFFVCREFDDAADISTIETPSLDDRVCLVEWKVIEYYHLERSIQNNFFMTFIFRMYVLVLAICREIGKR